MNLALVNNNWEDVAADNIEASSLFPIEVKKGLLIESICAENKSKRKKSRTKSISEIIIANEGIVEEKKNSEINIS